MQTFSINSTNDDGSANLALVHGQTWVGAVASLMLPTSEPVTFAALDREIGAASVQIRTAATTLVDGAIRLGCALYLMRHTEAWRQHGYSSFEDYCERRHAISARTAQRYMRPIEQLGNRLPELLASYDRATVYLLAEVYRLDPDVFDMLTARHSSQGFPGAMSHDELQRLVQDLRDQNAHLAIELQAAIDERDSERAIGRTMTDRLARLEAQLHEVLQANVVNGREIERLSAENYRLRRQINDQASNRPPLATAERQQSDRRPNAGPPHASGALAKPTLTTGTRFSTAGTSPAPMAHQSPERTIVSVLTSALVMLHQHVGDPSDIPLSVANELAECMRHIDEPTWRLWMQLTVIMLEAGPYQTEDTSLVAQALRRLVINESPHGGHG